MHIVGAHGYPVELNDVLDMLARNEIDPEQMITRRFESADMLKAFDAAHRPDAAAKVLVRFDA